MNPNTPNTIGIMAMDPCAKTLNYPFNHDFSLMVWTEQYVVVSNRYRANQPSDHTGISAGNWYSIFADQYQWFVDWALTFWSCHCSLSALCFVLEQRLPAPHDLNLLPQLTVDASTVSNTSTAPLHIHWWRSSFKTIIEITKYESFAHATKSTENQHSSNRRLFQMLNCLIWFALISAVFKSSVISLLQNWNASHWVSALPAEPQALHLWPWHVLM